MQALAPGGIALVGSIVGKELHGEWEYTIQQRRYPLSDDDRWIRGPWQDGDNAAASMVTNAFVEELLRRRDQGTFTDGYVNVLGFRRRDPLWNRFEKEYFFERESDLEVPNYLLIQKVA